MIQVFLVEDELHTRNELKYILGLHPSIEVVGETDEIKEALVEIEDLQPDCIFLDINFYNENGNGLDLAKALNRLDKKPYVIFVTAYNQYAVDAFELEAIDYVVKPFSEKRINQALEKLLKYKSLNQHNESISFTTNDKLVFKGEDRIHIVNSEEIIYVGTENRKVYVKTIKDKYDSGLPLHQIEKKLKGSFIRVHRGYIANTNHVVAIEPWFNRSFILIFTDGSKVPISRSYLNNVKTTFGI